MDIAPMLGSYGLPPGVAEEAVMEVSHERTRGKPIAVTLVSLKPLPPRYTGAQRVADFTLAGCCADDERVLSYSTGPCAVIALPRIERTQWGNDGSGWRVLNRTVRPG